MKEGKVVASVCLCSVSRYLYLASLVDLFGCDGRMVAHLTKAVVEG